MFSLCEVSGYLWNSFLYVGKDTVETNEHEELAKNLGKSGEVVPNLISDLFDKGYHLYIDNCYTRKKLLNFLRDRDTVACGTAMGNRIKAPKSLKNQPLEKGGGVYWRNENLLMVRYKDKKEIFFLSTIHDIQTERMPKQGQDKVAPSKLKLINDYNANMGGVDWNGALIGNYTCVGKSFKWTVKVAIHYVEEAVLSSFILYDKINPNKCSLWISSLML